jgi:hypothetical protein
MATALVAASLGVSGLMKLSPRMSARLFGLEPAQNLAWPLTVQAAGVRDLVVNSGLI